MFRPGRPNSRNLGVGLRHRFGLGIQGMAESPREQLRQRFSAHVHSKLDEFERRIAEIERQLAEVSRAVASLSAWQKFEVEEQAGTPRIHKGNRVIGRIPIWGSGRYLLVLRTPKDRFELDID